MKEANQHKASVSKWTVYLLTFVTYATFHSIRSAWSSLKNMFYNPPFDYSVEFLGFVDMLVVFVLAVSLTTLGHRVEGYGARKCLLIGMILLIVITTILGALLVVDVTSKALYIILYGLGIGLFSATGWPACLYLLSQYFDKKDTTALPIWNGTSQFGDFLALFISDIVIEGLQADVSITLLIIPFIMTGILILNIIYLPKDKVVQQVEERPKDMNELNQQKVFEQKSESDKDKLSVKNVSQQLPYPKLEEKLIQKAQQQPNLKETEEIKIKSQQKNELSDQIQLPVSQKTQSLVQNQLKNDKEISEKQTASKLSEVIMQNTQFDTTPVNFSNVWCLPGVALYVIANAVIKSVNAIIMTWFVFYLSLPENDMKDESRVIAILWALGVFGGSIIGGKVNPEYSKIKFMFCMLLSGAMFLTMENMHQKLYQIEISIAIIVCSLSFGVPYNMLNAAVPIMLGQKDQIKHRPGAKSAIISLMEGFGMGVSAFSILLVPLIDVHNIHIVLSVYCLIAILTLGTAQFTQKGPKNVPTTSQSDRQQKGSYC